MVYAGFEAGRIRELLYKICRRKIVYQGIETGKKYCQFCIVYAEIGASKKDCLCKGLMII